MSKTKNKKAKEVKIAKPCPMCKARQATHVLGVIKNGWNGDIQKYFCKDCRTGFTGNKTGRPRLGEKPLTAAEKASRYYHSMTPEEKAAYNRKRRSKKKKKTGSKPPERNTH